MQTETSFRCGTDAVRVRKMLNLPPSMRENIMANIRNSKQLLRTVYEEYLDLRRRDCRRLEKISLKVAS
jgi:hypothetical protein